MGYVRFVVQRVDEDSCRRRGLFVALGVLSDSGDLFDHERERYRDCLAWFDAHLARPRRFARARRSHPRAIAISWFKPGATEHIGRMRAMAAILDAHGMQHAVDMHEPKEGGVAPAAPLRNFSCTPGTGSRRQAGSAWAPAVAAGRRPKPLR